MSDIKAETSGVLQAFVDIHEKIDDSRHHFICTVTDGQSKAQVDVVISSLVELKNALRGTKMRVESSKDLDALQPGSEIDLSLPPADIIPPDTDDDKAVKAFETRISDWLHAAKLERNGFQTEPSEPIHSELEDTYAKASITLQPRYKTSILLIVPY